MNDFLENFYGTFFTPSETFEKLKQEPKLVQSFLIVIFISSLTPLMNISAGNGFSAIYSWLKVFNAPFVGILSWLFFTFFIEIMAIVFQKGGKTKTLLCLTAFALLPWVFIAPVSLLKTGGMFLKTLAILISLVCWLWSSLLTAFAVIKTYEISPQKIIILSIIPLCGMVICYFWIYGFFKTLIQISH